MDKKKRKPTYMLFSLGMNEGFLWKGCWTCRFQNR